MRVRFLHTADWQLGKPFAGVEDASKRARLQHERFAVLARIAAAGREHGAEFVVVAGDLFDSPHATMATVSQACSAIGALGVPVYATPGNHDHGGPDSLWEQSFFQHESAALAPNLRVLRLAEPVDIGGAVLYPCPLLRRHEFFDPTHWLRSFPPPSPGPASNRPRIVLAHGSTQGFESGRDEEDAGDSAANQIDLTRLAAGAYDYVALGDWHGTKQVGPAAWYAGTPELDRFPKGGDYDPGNILLVSAGRGEPPEVIAIPTRRIGWHLHEFTFSDDAGVAQLAVDLQVLLGARAGGDLLRLVLRGSLGLEATTRLETLLAAYAARLISLRLTNHTVVAPTPDEITAMTQRASDPLIARVAATLVARAAGETEAAAVARTALRELHAQLPSAGGHPCD